MIRGHGGNIHELARALGCRPDEIIDMSSNMNPLGPPEGLIRFLKDHVNAIRTLPEVDAQGTVERFGARWRLSPDQVAAGNGTTQFIFTLPRALASKRALIVGPTYADYADSCRMNGVSCDFFLTREEDAFQPDLTVLARRLEGADTVFICNPNNPTGRLISADALIPLIDAHPDVRFIVDESYLPFVEEETSESMIPKNLPNVLVLSSLSKIFRIPGLRIGFVAASAENIRRLNRFALPWSVNSLSQAAAGHLLEPRAEIDAFVRETRAYLAGERQSMTETLESAAGLKCFPSRTSFILIRLFGSHTAETLASFLAASKILIRNCANFSGLSNRFVRISLKNAEINRKCAQILRERLR